MAVIDQMVFANVQNFGCDGTEKALCTSLKVKEILSKKIERKGCCSGEKKQEEYHEVDP